MKNTILLDTNIILDFLIHREPYYDNANAIMTLCAHKEVYGYIAFHSISNLFYILRKYVNEEQRRQLLKDLCNILTIAAANHAEVQKAIEQSIFKDFEDCLQDKCALSVHADYIITRNIKDFTESETKAILPSDFLQLQASSH